MFSKSIVVLSIVMYVSANINGLASGNCIGEKRFYFINEVVDYSEAESNCNSYFENGQLATFSNSKEYLQIVNVIKDGDDYFGNNIKANKYGSAWIGLNDLVTEGRFKFIDDDNTYCNDFKPNTCSPIDECIDTGIDGPEYPWDPNSPISRLYSKQVCDSDAYGYGGVTYYYNSLCNGRIDSSFIMVDDPCCNGGCEFLPQWGDVGPSDNINKNCVEVFGWGNDQNGMNDIECTLERNFVCDICDSIEGGESVNAKKGYEQALPESHKYAMFNHIVIIILLVLIVLLMVNAMWCWYNITTKKRENNVDVNEQYIGNQENKILINENSTYNT